MITIQQTRGREIEEIKPELVPVRGQMILDTEIRNFKVGDGETDLKTLPWWIRAKRPSGVDGGVVEYKRLSHDDITGVDVIKKYKGLYEFYNSLSVNGVGFLGGKTETGAKPGYLYSEDINNWDNFVELSSGYVVTGMTYGDGEFSFCTQNSDVFWTDDYKQIKKDQGLRPASTDLSRSFRPNSIAYGNNKFITCAADGGLAIKRIGLENNFYASRDHALGRSNYRLILHVKDMFYLFSRDYVFIMQDSKDINDALKIDPWIKYKMKLDGEDVSSSYPIREIMFANDMFVGIYRYGSKTNTIVTSNDAINWETKININNEFPNKYNSGCEIGGIGYGDGLFVLFLKQNGRLVGSAYDNKTMEFLVLVSNDLLTWHTKYYHEDMSTSDRYLYIPAMSSYCNGKFFTGTSKGDIFIINTNKHQ